MEVPGLECRWLGALLELFFRDALASQVDVSSVLSGGDCFETLRLWEPSPPDAPKRWLQSLTITPDMPCIIVNARS
jgi:hypothetical protein